MTVSPRYIDYAFMKSMMSSDELGYKLEFVKKVSSPLYMYWLVKIEESTKLRHVD
jgi:hypothetical protein